MPCPSCNESEGLCCFTSLFPLLQLLTQHSIFPNLTRPSPTRVQPARIIHRLAVLPSMSSATAIKDLKEGNAIEEDLAKLLKGGLNTIADNMLQECRKRSAALEDLEENLEEVGCVGRTLARSQSCADSKLGGRAPKGFKEGRGQSLSRPCAECYYQALQESCRREL